MSFGGTITLDNATFAAVVEGVVRSVLRHGFKRIVLLNAHGGNENALRTIADDLTPKLGVPIVQFTYWYAAAVAIAKILETQGGLQHACEAETSMMMAVRPDLVAEDRIPLAKSNTTPDVSDVVGGGVYMLAQRRQPIRDGRHRQPGGRQPRRRASALFDAISSALADKLCNAELWALPWTSETTVMSIELTVNGRDGQRSGRCGDAAAGRAAQRAGPERLPLRLRAGAVRHLHGADRRRGGIFLRAGDRFGCRPLGHDDRGAWHPGGAACRCSGRSWRSRPASAATACPASSISATALLAPQPGADRARTSSRRWTSTSVAAAPIPGSSPPCRRPPLPGSAGMSETLPLSIVNNRRLDKWLRFQPDRTVKLAVGKVEIGQGVLIALSQIAAEELDVALDRIDILSGDTEDAPDEGSTSSSQSIEVSGRSVRLVSAELRARVLGRLAQRLNCAPEDLTVDDGAVPARRQPDRLRLLELRRPRGLRRRYRRDGRAETARRPTRSWDSPCPGATCWRK